MVLLLGRAGDKLVPRTFSVVQMSGWEVVCQSDEVMVEGHMEETSGALDLEQDGMELLCIHTACPGEAHGDPGLGCSGCVRAPG